MSLYAVVVVGRPETTVLAVGEQSVPHAVRDLSTEHPGRLLDVRRVTVHPGAPVPGGRS